MRPVPLISAAAAAALLVATAAPAGAQTTSTPAAGEVVNTLSLLQLSSGDEALLEVGVLELIADTLSATPAASVVVTPAFVSGEPVGQQEVTSSEETTVPGVASPAGLAGLLAVAGPDVVASASTTADSATSRAGTDSLGGVELLGAGMDLTGTVSAVSTSTPSGAVGEQTLEITDLALPSLAELLAALGIDLSKLPVEVLYELLGQLELSTDVIDGLEGQLDAALAEVQGAIDALQAEIAAAAADLATKTAALDEAIADAADAAAAVAALEQAKAEKDAAVDQAEADLDEAEVELVAALDALPVDATCADAPDVLGASVVALCEAVTDAQQAVTDATAAATQAAADLVAAEPLARAAEAAVAAAQLAVDTAQAILDGLIDDLLALLETLPQTGALRDAIMAVLSGTPLLSLDALRVVTRATVDSNTAGGQRAEIIGGEVQGLQVLGTDVLENVLGESSVELLDLARTQLEAVNALIAELTGVIETVLTDISLGDIPLFPTLDVPAPTIAVLDGAPETGVQDGFGVASALVQVLSVTLPSITLPAALALPDAGALPAFDLGRVSAAAADGDLVSRELTVGVGSLGPAARFRPAVDVQVPGGGGGSGDPTPTTNNRPLPATGAPALAAVAGLALLSGAALLRRRRAPGDQPAEQ